MGRIYDSCGSSPRKCHPHALGLDLHDFRYVMEALVGVRSLGCFSLESVTLAIKRVVVKDSSWIGNLTCGTMLVDPGGWPTWPFRNFGPFGSNAGDSRMVFTSPIYSRGVGGSFHFYHCPRSSLFLCSRSHVLTAVTLIAEGSFICPCFFDGSSQKYRAAYWRCCGRQFWWPR
jgi:hypothetical protein